MGIRLFFERKKKQRKVKRVLKRLGKSQKRLTKARKARIRAERK